MQRLAKKTAVVSHVLPPSPSGQSVMLMRVLEEIDPRDYVLITSAPEPATDGDEAPALPAPCYRISPAAPLTFRWPRALGPVRGIVSVVANVLRRAAEIARIVRRERCESIVACTGDLYDLPAAYVASRVLGIGFHPYVFDDYVYQWPASASRRVAERIAPYVMRGADSVIVPNEFLRDEYRRRYHIMPVIVRNPIARPAVGARVANEGSARSRGQRIVYTGAVYHAHFDAFRNLVAALALLADPRFRLHVYTANTQDELRAAGIEGPVVTHPHQPPERMDGIHDAADMLFLPLAFHSTIPEVIRTSAPGKIGEYLASGRPILVHAPADSFVAWYFRTHECGMVVDELSPERMAAALRRLDEDGALRERLVHNARERARLDFDPVASRAAFMHAISLNSARAQDA